MRKRIIIILLSLLLIAVTPFIIKYLNIHIFSTNQYDSSFERDCISDDRRIQFTCDNRKGLFGDGEYDGTYSINGETIDITITFSYNYIHAQIDDNYNNYIFAGRRKDNLFNDTVTIVVEEATNMISEYKDGDTIVLRYK